MPYTIELSRRAQQDIEEAFLHIQADSPASALHWRHALELKLRVLERLPEAFGFAPENYDAKADVRQVLFGRYRVLYTVRESTVFVLTVRHGARLFLSGSEVDQIE
jgi:plasmid stabilization system protein ParE